MEKYREIFERKLKSMDEILHQISCMDQADDEEQLAEVIPLMLKAMGEYTNADRVYVFDWISETHDNMQNTFEWCADGVEPEIQNLQNIPVQRMPKWMEAFSAKKNIVIHNVEDVAEEMPSEYALLKLQNIRSVIAVPVYTNRKLTGFIGVDNPDLSHNDVSINLLLDVGGHLGSVRENLRMMKKLEDEQTSLENSLKELQHEKSILDVLSIDYTSIYFCDLLKDTIIPLKQENETNAILLEKELHTGLRTYSFRMKYYFEHFVVKESAPDFLDKLSADI